MVRGKPNDVLLIKLGALGDVIRTTCLLGPIRRKYGPCRLTWVTAPEALPLLQGLGIERVLAAGPRTLEALRRRSFDLVLNLDEDSAACAAASAPSSKALVGGHLKEGKPAYTPDSSPYFDLGLLNRGADGSMARADALKKANRKTYQQLWAGVLGLDLGTYPRGYEPLVAPTVAERAAAAKLLKSTPKVRVGLNLGAGARWPAKQPSLEHAAQVARGLAEKGCEVVYFGGEAELERNRELARTAGAGAVAPIKPLRVFAAMLARCRALVSTDSLALHLACAMRTPCVALFGPTSAAEIELYGRGIKLEPKPACSCYYQPRCTAAAHCVDQVPASAVVAAVGLLL
ncbi:MAG: glycosyltransferase family 9 protein [Elusimicrobia bacterium]|nr:glycosyltransferase family 9 protein [Elusimicrobiota bacterium]